MRDVLQHGSRVGDSGYYHQSVFSIYLSAIFLLWQYRGILLADDRKKESKNIDFGRETGVTNEI